eukprot:COSAG02_NODE_2607_length_8436_cov_3.451841_5_plen_96_part_00
MIQKPAVSRANTKLRPANHKQATRFAHWNMARITKSQIQMLELFRVYSIGLGLAIDHQPIGGMRVLSEMRKIEAITKANQCSIDAAKHLGSRNQE